MEVSKTNIEDVKVITPTLFKDERGYFFESFNKNKFEAIIGRTAVFTQDNQSKSKKGVLRGLHYQLEPFAQAKLVRVVQGEVFDVAVDLRKTSPTYGQWVGEILSSKNKKQLWIPEGFAHGFLTLSNTAIFMYKTTGQYQPSFERCIRWDDPTLSIIWPDNIKFILSPKDLQGELI